MIIRFNKTILFIFLLGLTVYAQTTEFTTYDIFKLKSVAETSTSPNGNFIAYTVIVPRPFTDKPGTDYRELYLFDVSSGQSKSLLAVKGLVTSPQWMGGANYILFKASLEEGKQTQVYKINIEGGEPINLTNNVSGSIRQFELSPDGSKLAYITTEPPAAKKNDLQKKGFDAEIYEEEYKDLNLYIRDLTSGSVKKITSNFSVFEFHWSPDGNKIAAAVSEKNLIDYEYMFKKIYLINPENGERTLLVDNPGKLSNFAWSPNSKHLAFVAGVDKNDPVDGSLFVTDVPNNKTFLNLPNYSLNFDGSVDNVAWKDNNTVLFSADEGVDVTLSELSIITGKRKLLIKPGEVVFSNFSFNDGFITLNGNTALHPSELYMFNFLNQHLKRLTNLNPWLTNLKLAKQKEITYKSRDGLDIQGVLLYPVDYIEGNKYPLIVYIHGGPESCEKNGWSTSYSKWGQVAAAQNYFVFMPNYRGSSGRGVKFSKMDFGDPAGPEFEDVIDGIDYLINKGMVDKNKVGIGGGSYGGYFSAWGATKYSSRFAAAVVFVGVSNQISKRYSTDIPYESHYSHWGSWVNDDYKLAYDRSPIKYADGSKTPTLILHGKVDPRVNPSQSLELYNALKIHGKAPVRLVWYPGQRHGNSKNTSKLDYALRTMRWFNFYLKGNNLKDKMPDKYINIE